MEVSKKNGDTIHVNKIVHEINNFLLSASWREPLEHVSDFQPGFFLSKDIAEVASSRVSFLLGKCCWKSDIFAVLLDVLMFYQWLIVEPTRMETTSKFPRTPLLGLMSSWIWNILKLTGAKRVGNEGMGWWFIVIIDHSPSLTKSKFHVYTVLYKQCVSNKIDYITSLIPVCIKKNKYIARANPWLIY